MRIVSLVPSLSETCHWLGVGDAVVGVTDFCTTPLDGFADARRVRGTKNPDVPGIVALQPDIVLANREENRERDILAIREAGIEVVVTYPRTVEEAAATVRAIGAVVGAPDRAEDLAATILQALAEVRGARRTPRPTLCPIWRRPWMAVGEDNYAADLLAACGLATVPRTGERYPRFEPDAVRGEVEAVLLPSEPYPFGAEHVRDFEGWDVAVRLVDGELLTWYGPRTPIALRMFADLRDALG